MSINMYQNSHVRVHLRTFDFARSKVDMINRMARYRVNNVYNLSFGSIQYIIIFSSIKRNFFIDARFSPRRYFFHCEPFD